MNSYSLMTWSRIADGRKPGVTGGGYSQLFESPPWQRRLTHTGAGARQNFRAPLDVGDAADPQWGFRSTLAGKPVTTAGTSATAPMWAALLVRLNQPLGQPVGCLNPIFYQ